MTSEVTLSKTEGVYIFTYFGSFEDNVSISDFV
jgi:hypothetical protein